MSLHISDGKLLERWPHHFSSFVHRYWPRRACIFFSMEMLKFLNRVLTEKQSTYILQTITKNTDSSYQSYPLILAFCSLFSSLIVLL